MALNGLIFNQRNNDSKNWRRILHAILGDGIIRGCDITFTANSITIGDGQFILSGGVIANDGAETIFVTPTLTDGYVRLKCRIDLTQKAQETGPGPVEWLTEFSATTTFPALTQEDINGTGSIYEGEVAVLQIVSGNITDVTRQMGPSEIDAEKLGGKLPNKYATAAQGTKADAAMPKSGGTFTGTVTSRVLTPYRNNTYNMGSSDKRYRDTYCFSQHLDSLLTFDNASASSWKNIQAFTTIAFRKRDAPGTAINIDAANCPAPSSVRYKENIQDVSEEDALKVLKLRPVAFDWKKGSGYEGSSKSFIAEEAAQIDERYAYKIAHITKPEVSHTDEKTGERVVVEPAEYEMWIEGLNQNPILCDLVALCQRQQRQIDGLLALLVEKGILTQEEIDGPGE